MDILNQIVLDMKKQEVRHFKLWATRTHADQDRKDVRLYDYIRKNAANYQEESILKQLYPNQKKGTFYRLKNRLMEELNKSLWIQHYKKNSHTYGLYLYSLCQLHYAAGRYKVAFHFLKRAEKENLQNENHEILNLIYGLFIKIAYELPYINPEEYTGLRKKNRSQLLAIDSLDDLLAALTYRINLSPNQGGQDKQLLELLQNTIDEHIGEVQINDSPKFRFKVYEAISRLLLQKNEYNAMEIFLKEKYIELTNDKLFTKKYHKEKLNILTFLVNTCFKNKKYKESLRWAEKMREAMNEWDGMLYKQFETLHIYALMQNYAVLDSQKAIALLENQKIKNNKEKTTYTTIFVYVNLASIYFSERKYRKSLKNLIELYLYDEFKNANDDFKLQMEIFELAVRYKLEQDELIERRIGQVRKTYNTLLSQEASELDLIFLNFLENLNLYNFSAEGKKEKQLLLAAYTSLSEIHSSRDDLVMNYKSFAEKQLAKLKLIEKKHG